MQKAIWSILTVLAVLVYAGVARADEPKAEEPKKESVTERQQRRNEAMKAAAAAEDWDKALLVLDEVLNDKEVPDADKLGANVNQFMILAVKKLDGAKACPLAKKISETKKDDPQLFNLLAWTILDTKDLKNRDLDLALIIATQAAELSKFERGDILDTLARAHYEKGELDKALDFQTKAVDKWQADPQLNDEQNEKAKSDMKETLAKYKAEKDKPKS